MKGSLTHRFVDVNGVRLHIAEQGEGPVNAALLDFLARIGGPAPR
jgi:hypothetical protein